MAPRVFRYEFVPEVSLIDVESTLLLALMATEALHGASRVQLEASHALDQSGRRCVVEADSQTGQDLNRIFHGLLNRELGPDAFKVARLQANIPSTPC